MIRVWLWVFVMSLASCRFSWAEQVEIQQEVVWLQQSDYSLTADIYRPVDVKTQRPGILLVHGGGWGAGSRADMAWFGQHLAEQGWVAASIDYRLVSPNGGQGEAAFTDVSLALKAMLDHSVKLGIDPQRVAILGGSAGGHLAARLAVNPTPLRAAVILWGPTNLAIAPNTLTSDQYGMLSSLLGQGYSQEQAKHASAYWNLTRHSAPHWLLIHGTEDPLVPVTQSRQFYQHLLTQGLDANYLELAGEGHGLQAKAAQQQAAESVLKFLHSVLDE